MKSSKDQSPLTELFAILPELKISEHECALAKQYLTGEAGEEVLGQFQRIDYSLIAISSDAHYDLNRVMKRLDRKETRAVCIRLFNLLFAIGHASCVRLFYFGSEPQTSFEQAQECALYKRITILIERWFRSVCKLVLRDIRKIVQGNPENLRNSIEPLRKEGRDYLLIALTDYFFMKYTEQTALLKENNLTEKIDFSEDAALLKEYEEGVLESLYEWLQQQSCFQCDSLIDAIREHRLTRELLKNIISNSPTEEEYHQLCHINNMAYLNFQLSDLLRDVVRVCLAVDAEKVLFAFRNVSEVLIGDSSNYDDLFWIEPDCFIRWAAVEKNLPILKRQLEKNQSSYLKAIEGEGYTTFFHNKHSKRAPIEDWIDAINALKDVLKEENPTLYEQIDAARPYYNKVIRYLVMDTPHADQMRAYLRGKCSISELYPYQEEYRTRYISYDFLDGHQRHCNDTEFFDRCKAYIVLTGSEYTRVVARQTEEVAQVEQFFQLLDAQKMDIAHQISGFIVSYKADEKWRGCKLEPYVEGAVNVFARYLNGARRQEAIEAFSGAAVEGRYLALHTMRKDIMQNRQEIMHYASDSAKLVREEFLDILCTENKLLYKDQGWLEDIKTLLGAKKAQQRELAAQILTRWQQEGGDFHELLLQAIKKEKNAKVLTLLQNALCIQEKNLSFSTLSREELVKQFDYGNGKKSLAWAYEKPYFPVHTIDGEAVSEPYLQAILLCYASQEKNGISKNAQLLAGDLHSKELAVYMNELFDRWLAQGADSQKRWVLYAAAIHGGEEMIQKLQHQIQEWPQMARGAIAAEAVKALALSPSPRALLLVDNIARKFKFKQVRTAAEEALVFAASELGITREELSDRIVPDLGFDENMERIFDYGERIFKVRISATLDLEVYDNEGKKLKKLPAPAKKDDAVKAAAAYEDFKQLKKQMKTVVNSQKSRMEYALFVRREWLVDDWTNLFVKNPLMHSFAIGLIWGVYEEGKRIQSFRYMEDGSFNTQDEEEYTLPEGAHISLVHPIELSDKEKATWKEQLADYEIAQPVAQIDRAVYTKTVEEANKKGIERFGGYVVNALSLNGKLTGLGWYRGSVQDGGGFYTYFREDIEANIGVELHFSGTFVGDMDDEVTIYDVRFYKAGTIEHGSYIYEEADAEKAYFLKDIPARYFSEIVLQLTDVTASSMEYDESWKADADLIS